MLKLNLYFTYKPLFVAFGRGALASKIATRAQ